MNKVYDPKKVTVIVDGMVVTGFAEGSIVSIEKNEDNVYPHVGAMGETVFALGCDETETATLSLASHSPTLAHLRNVAKKRGVFNFQVVDMNNNVIITCDNAMMVKTPDYTVGKEIEEVDVEIFLAHEPR